MFGFHRRSRSLIPVGDLARWEKLEALERTRAVREEVDHEHDCEETDGAVARHELLERRRRQRNIAMVYLLFFAEAVMAASLASQMTVLLSGDDAAACATVNTSFLRSILECAYSFGNTAGWLWGWAADRHGRRRVAVAGLCALSLCCLGMGFASSFVVSAALRFVAGVAGSAVTVAGLTVLADLTHGRKDRITVVTRLPLVAVAGSLGPLLANTLYEFSARQGVLWFERFPGLPAQTACGSVLLVALVLEICMLDETLPTGAFDGRIRHNSIDVEKLSFLGAHNDSVDSLGHVEFSDRIAETPRISTAQLMAAPAIALLLTSYSVLSLHSSTFDLALPHLGRVASTDGGIDVPCSWLGAVIVTISMLAAVFIARCVPALVRRDGVLALYRRLSLWFPVVYAIVPVAGLMMSRHDIPLAAAAVVSGLAMLAKAILAGNAQVLILLLVLAAAPDATSTGTVIGVIYVSQFFKALAVGVIGIGYYLSSDVSLVALNSSLWAALVIAAAVGATITYRLREKPRVGADIPEECLVWEGLFDSESDDGTE